MTEGSILRGVQALVSDAQANVSGIRADLSDANIALQRSIEGLAGTNPPQEVVENIKEAVDALVAATDKAIELGER